MSEGSWTSTDPGVVEEKRRETAEMLCVIASAIADGALRNFKFTAREEDQTVVRRFRPPRRRKRVTVRFELEADAELFAEEVRRRRGQMRAIATNLQET